MMCGSGGSKSRLAKAAGAEPAGQMRHEKVHAVVARSTFPSENGQNTRGADHFWKLRCRKSARRCGAKHQNVQNTPMSFGSSDHVVARSTFGSSDHFWSLRCRKSARRCGAHFEEAHFFWKLRCRKKSRKCQNVQNTPCSDHFWKFRCRKSARRCGAKHISKSKC